MSRSAPSLALIKAFCPGAAAHLRQCCAADWQSPTFSGERIVVEYDLPDPPTRARAFALVQLAQGAAGADIPMRGWMFAEIAARVRDDILTVEGVAIRD